ncbi:MAG: hypothetical protein J6C95_07105 [Muribaculaceae bacterium]|nr:hypothetical protein [Muribaculaceae bacterium]
MEKDKEDLPPVERDADKTADTGADNGGEGRDEVDDGRPTGCGNHFRKCSDCRRNKLHSFDWLADIPGGMAGGDIVEVQFKNTRKGYFKNTTNLPLGPGDVVAVEAAPGHDIGTVTLTGELAALRMKRAAGRNTPEPKRVFRLAKPADIEKFEEAKAREDDTMIRARKIAESLKLNMKIGDVEYQGDGNKAIFYYIADERVDFRQLIKILAETFKVRIEMKQIGARQEAGRIGGIGPCGRPLCCSQWMTNFVSVATSAARYQDISLNPQKLAGQCAKLKCCLNFEVDAYVEASKKMPPREVRLETADATYFHFKSDIFNRLVTYSTDKNLAANLVTISADRVFEIISLNKAGEKPLSLIPDQGDKKAKPKSDFGDVLSDEDDLSRFDRKKKKRRKPQGQKNKQADAKPKPEGERQAAGQEQNAQQPKPQNQKQRHKQKKKPGKDKPGNESAPQS